MLTECKFCSPVAAPSPYLDNLGLNPYLDKAVLMQTENFTVIPDILPVQPEGRHVLIVPKPTDEGTHFLSYAGLPEGMGYPGQVFRILCRIEEAWKSNVSIFEHGSVVSGNKHQSVYHAHAHVMETKEIDVIRYMSAVLDRLGISFQVYGRNVSSSYVHNLWNIGARGKNYLSVQNRNKILIAYDQDKDGTPTDTMPSQISQQSMSRLMTGEVVNWKTIFDPNHPLSGVMASLSAQRLAKLVRSLPDCHF